MPTLSTTIEDTSPVLIYSGSGGGDWVAGSSSNDSFADLYSQSSFMVTDILEANVSFSFYGTGVQIYGAERPNHGNYQIKIDETLYHEVDGAVTSNPGTFQTALFSTVALDNGYHEVTMINLGATPGNSFLDIDFLTWQTPVGLSDESLLALTVQDSDSSFQYTPASAWNPSPPNVGMFSGGSGHITSTAGAYVEYTFTLTSSSDAAAVAIFGPVGPNCAPYSVQLDGGSPANYSAFKAFYRPQQILFQAGNLGKGQHTVRLASEAWNNSALSFAIDFAEVFTTPSLQSSRLSTGAIVGISIGSVAVAIAIAAFFIIFRRHRPSKFGKFFHLKGKSGQTPGLVSEAFEYQPISVAESTAYTSPAATYGNLSTQASYSTLRGTPPSTGLIPSSGGTYGSTQDLLPPERYGPNTQVITIPFTPDGKYRPDLPATPQLMPPPQGVRRNPSVGHQGQTLQLRPSRSDMQLIPLSPGQPMTEEGARQDNGRPVQQPQAVLAPVRRSGQLGLPARHSASNLRTSITAPPEYQRDPS